MKLSCLLCSHSGGCVFILEVQKLIGILTVLRCIFSFTANLEIGGDLSRGQAQMGQILTFKVKFDFEGRH